MGQAPSVLASPSSPPELSQQSTRRFFSRLNTNRQGIPLLVEKVDRPGGTSRSPSTEQHELGVVPSTIYEMRKHKTGIAHDRVEVRVRLVRLRHSRYEEFTPLVVPGPNADSGDRR